MEKWEGEEEEEGEKKKCPFKCSRVGGIESVPIISSPLPRKEDDDDDESYSSIHFQFQGDDEIFKTVADFFLFYFNVLTARSIFFRH